MCVGKYIKACITPIKEAEELRAETSLVLKRNCPPTKPNISWQETKAIMEHKDRGVILKMDKRVAMVLMNIQDYTDKVHQLLADSNTYRLINKEPTNKLKNMLAQTLRDINHRED